MNRLRVFWPNLLLLLLLSAKPALAADYNVGPGQPLAAIADVPWATLAPGEPRMRA